MIIWVIDRVKTQRYSFNRFSISFIVFALGCSACLQGSSFAKTNKNNQVKDGVIYINDTMLIKFERYNKHLGLWYDPYLMKTGSKEMIIGFEYSNGSSLAFQLSPDNHYLLLDEVSMDYLYISDKDSMLVENAFCNLINLYTSKVIYRYQEHCDATWNSESQLISGNKVIFASEYRTSEFQKNLTPSEFLIQLKQLKQYQGLEIKDCRNLIRNHSLNIDNVVDYNNIGYYLEQAGMFDEAVLVLKEVVTYRPNRVVAYINLGDAYWGLEEYEKAKQAYGTYIEQMKSSGKESRIPSRVFERVE